MAPAASHAHVRVCVCCVGGVGGWGLSLSVSGRARLEPELRRGHRTQSLGDGVENILFLGRVHFVDQ